MKDRLMNWHLHELGFLPPRDPLVRLNEPVLQEVENLAADLPRLVEKQGFRSRSTEALTALIDWDTVLAALDDEARERLFMLYSYFASAYVHAPGQPSVDRIPRCLAAPLVRLAPYVGRPPILSYASYCLHNWRRSDPAGPVALGNLQLLQNFSLPGKGKEDEDWFILVHVDIEARAGSALQALSRSDSVMAQDDAEEMARLLETVVASLEQMNRTLARMPEGCSPNVYFNKVRPYIFGFTDVVYEGCFDNAPQTFRGETGAQSSIVPTLLKALGISHKASLLTTHLEDMRRYMPPAHRQFVESQVSLRDRVRRWATAGGNAGRRVQERYNDCLGQLLAFRSRHLEYAVNYIEKKVSNPIGTGGTPYIPWLQQLLEETREFLLAS